MAMLVKRYAAIFLFLLFFLVESQGQNTFLKADESDPEATVLLEKVNASMLSYKSYRMDFDMNYKEAGGEAKSVDGLFMQKGKKFLFDVGDQMTVCDGVYSWLFFKDRNEVQINDIDQDESVSLTPAYFLNIHRSGDYVYAITQKKNGTYRIDFKPLDKNADFSKIGLDINVANNLPEQLIIFNKDGSRFVFDKIKITPDAGLEDKDFIFDMSKYPGIYMEDLRLD